MKPKREEAAKVISLFHLAAAVHTTAFGSGLHAGAGRPQHWAATDREIALKVLKLIEAARCGPVEGIGKPEPLKNIGADVWSRRITQDDRLVYRMTTEGVEVLQARYHY